MVKLVLKIWVQITNLVPRATPTTFDYTGLSDEIVSASRNCKKTRDWVRVCPNDINIHARVWQIGTAKGTASILFPQRRSQKFEDNGSMVYIAHVYLLQDETFFKTYRVSRATNGIVRG